MKETTDRHFEGVRQILPKAQRLVLFDFDTSENACHPDPTNPALSEWKRRNIENYLLVPQAWQRAAATLLKLPENDLSENKTVSFYSFQSPSEPIQDLRGQGRTRDLARVPDCQFLRIPALVW